MISEKLPETPVGKIMVVVDIPQVIKDEFGITEEEMNKIVTDSVYMIVEMVDKLIETKKGKKKKEDEPSDIYS